MPNKEIMLPDYKHGLLGLMTSIKKYFDIEPQYETLETVDELLNSNKYRTVVVCLMDGMGTKIMDKHLDKKSFLQTHLIDEISSTMPATTVAATTLVRNGISPIETGWLAWHQWFEEVNDEVCMFNGKSYYNEDVKYDKNIGYDKFKYRTIFEQIREKGYRADEYFPGWSEYHPVKKYNQMVKNIIKYVKSGDGKQYLYCYWDEPDHTLHGEGTTSKKVHKLMKSYDSYFKRLARNLPEDAIVFVIADHGHIDSELINLADYPDFLDTLVRLPTFESRNSSFFVKEGRDEEFKELFIKYFGEYFNLYTKQEVLDGQFFGPNPSNNHEFEYLIGDYQACAIDKYMLNYSADPSKEFMVSAHAGITKDEMCIPLIKITKE